MESWHGIVKFSFVRIVFFFFFFFFYNFFYNDQHWVSARLPWMVGGKMSRALGLEEEGIEWHLCMIWAWWGRSWPSLTGQGRALDHCNLVFVLLGNYWMAGDGITYKQYRSSTVTNNRWCYSVTSNWCDRQHLSVHQECSQMWSVLWHLSSAINAANELSPMASIMALCHMICYWSDSAVLCWQCCTYNILRPGKKHTKNTRG